MSSQKELNDVLKDERVSSGEIPILLPETGWFEITSGSPLLHVAAGDPRITVTKDATPTIIASGISQPYMEAYDTSKPVMEARGLSGPVMVAYDTSEPNMNAFDSSKPVMEALDSSSPTVNWASTAPNLGLVDMR